MQSPQDPRRPLPPEAEAVTELRPAHSLPRRSWGSLGVGSGSSWHLGRKHGPLGTSATHLQLMTRRAGRPVPITQVPTAQ